MVGLKELPTHLYNVNGREIAGGVKVQCEVCGLPDAQRQATVIRYIPNEIGEFLGLQPQQEILFGSHSGCRSK